MEIAIVVPIFLLHLKIVHEVIKYANNRYTEIDEDRHRHHCHHEDTPSLSSSYSSYKYYSDSDDDLQII